MLGGFSPILTMKTSSLLPQPRHKASKTDTILFCSYVQRNQKNTFDVRGLVRMAPGPWPGENPRHSCCSLTLQPVALTGSDALGWKAPSEKVKVTNGQ